jgi:tRNA1(Val) A37 N6-methylase TrmN6
MYSDSDEPLTNDAFLGGKLTLLQPKYSHHRSGMDAIMLAASFPDHLAGRVFDFGSGVGAAGFCLALRRPDLSPILVERDPALIAIARQAISLPQNIAFADRIKFQVANILDKPTQREIDGIGPNEADHVIMNPPYFARGTIRESSAEGRVEAHVFTEDDLSGWMRTAASCIRGAGSLTVVYRMDRLPALLQAIGKRFGSIIVQPIHPRDGQPAHRLLLHAIKGSRGPFQLLPGLSLHSADGAAFQPWAENVQREAAGLNCFVRS